MCEINQVENETDRGFLATALLKDQRRTIFDKISENHGVTTIQTEGISCKMRPTLLYGLKDTFINWIENFFYDNIQHSDVLLLLK